MIRGYRGSEAARIAADRELEVSEAENAKARLVRAENIRRVALANRNRGDL